MVPSLDVLLGPFQIGNAISMFLFGLTTYQTYIYYHSFPTDPVAHKILVAAVWLIECAHQLCVIQVIYGIVVPPPGNANPLGLPLSVVVDIVIFLYAVVILLVQSFFTNRLWAATKRKRTTLFLLSLLAIRFGVIIWVGVRTFTIKDYGNFFVQWRWLLIVEWASGACIDILMTLALCYDLHLRRRSAIPRTARLVHRVFIWCTATGMVTCIPSILMLICFITMPHNLIWTAVFIPSSRFFSNSMLAALNSRTLLRRMDVNTIFTMSLHTIVADDSMTGKQNAYPSPADTENTVTTQG